MSYQKDKVAEIQSNLFQLKSLKVSRKDISHSNKAIQLQLNLPI